LKGPSGCGKTTLARIIGKELKCSERDFHEYNTANTRGIDTIREIASSCNYVPLYGKTKVYLLDEAHKITSDAQHALLKLLEDTPNHVFFILCTTDDKKLIKTILTRCHTFEVKKFKMQDAFRLMDFVGEKEGLELSRLIKREIYRVSEGLPRQILVILDSVVDVNDEKEALEIIENSSIEVHGINELGNLLMKSNYIGKWKEIVNIYKNINKDPEEIRRGLLGYFKNILLKGENVKAAILISYFMDSLFYSGEPGLVFQLFQACNEN
jgi:DNA polymerase-3 subunit gamma/tau